MIVGPGQILADKYQLVSLLGKGGMGSVWRAEHLALRSQVAVKLIDPALVENAEACGRFVREAQSAAALRSPHVVQILDYGVDAGTPYIVMELLEGESLANRLERVKRLSPADTARVISDVCRAVGRAHQAGIVHRDLKPDNIFLVPNEESEIAKVLDFGIAKGAMPGIAIGSGTRTGAMLGTPYYMSPEQVGGSKDVDWRSDLWALGIIAFECLTGVRPFDCDTLGGLVLAICTQALPAPSSVAAVPVGFDAWFARAVDRVPAQRYQSAKDLAQSLRIVCGVEEGLPVPRAPHEIPIGVPNEMPGSASPTEVSQPAGHRFASTSVAGSLSNTAVPPPSTGHTARWVAPGLVLFGLLGACVAGWTWFSARDVGAPSTSAAATTSTLAATPTVLPTSVAAPSDPTAGSVHEPSAVPVPSQPAAEASASAAVAPVRAPRGVTPRPPVLTPPPQRPPGTQPNSGSPAATPTPPTSPDPLGI